MRCCFFFYCLLFFGASCKPPLPVYFDNPIGARVQGFDTLISGNYLLLNDIMEKAESQFLEKYIIRYDKIILKEYSHPEEKKNDINYEEIKNILGAKESPQNKEEKSCDSIFNSMCKFNKLISAETILRIDKIRTKKPVAGIVKITYDRIFFIAIDSSGSNMHDTLLALTPSIILTKYSGKYFVNFKTPFGWEIMQFDLWEGKYLSIRPFYFTGYNHCSKTVSELIASTEKIYPGISPVYNSDKKIIGFKGNMNPKLLTEKFKKSEVAFLMAKMK